MAKDPIRYAYEKKQIIMEKSPLNSYITKNKSKLHLDYLGNMQHLLSINNLNKKQIIKILDKAENYLQPSDQLPFKLDTLKGRTLVNLFFEPSTRTKTSFELAAKKLGADVINLDIKTSAQKKGESLLDTLYTLQAMQIDMIAIRHEEGGIPAYLAEHANDQISILNAGESILEHPTQALLDLLTIRQAKHSFEGISVAIVGDIKHSRVARSTSSALEIIGVKDLRLICPQSLSPNKLMLPKKTRLFHNLKEGISEVDVIIALRIQHERITKSEDIPNDKEYYDSFGIKLEDLKYAAKDVVVMHPGPMNKGVDIDPKVVESQSCLVQRQVSNGVAIRMAIMTKIIKNLENRFRK